MSLLSKLHESRHQAVFLCLPESRDGKIRGETEILQEASIMSSYQKLLDQLHEDRVRRETNRRADALLRKATTTSEVLGALRARYKGEGARFFERFAKAASGQGAPRVNALRDKRVDDLNREIDAAMARGATALEIARLEVVRNRLGAA